MTTKQSILEVVIDPSKAKSGAKEASDAYNKLQAEVLSNTNNIQSAFNRFNSLVGANNNKLVSRMTAQWNRLRKYLVDTFTAGIKKAIFGMFNAVFGKLRSMLEILGPAGLLGSINKIVEAGIKMQKFSVMFSVITGNMRDSKNELQGIIAQAQKLGLAFDAAAAPFAKFFAAARRALKSSDIREIFNAFSEVSVALHLNKQEVTGVFLALQQIASKGRVSMEELRLQLAERVPGAMALAAESMGLSMQEFERQVRTGTMNAGRFLVNFGKKLHEEFGDAAVEASKLAQAAINNFHTSFLLFLNQISESGVLSSVVKFLNLVKEKFLDNKRLATLLGKALSNVIDKVTTYVDTLSNDKLLETTLSVANAFIRIYNTVVDLIPKLDTIFTLISGASKYVTGIADWFSGKNSDDTYIQDLKEGIADVNVLIKQLESKKDSLRFFNLNPTIDQTSELSAQLTALKDVVLPTLQNRLKNLSETQSLTGGPDKLPLFTMDDLGVGGKPSVGDSSNLPGEHEGNYTAKLDAIKGFMSDAQSILSTPFHIKIVGVKDEMLEAKAAVDDLKMTLTEPVTMDNAADMLSTAQELVVQSNIFLEARNKYLTAANETVMKTAEDLSAYLSFGSDRLGEELETRKTMITDAANYGIVEKARANEIIETMELQHQAKMGSIVAQGALNMKEFETKTFKAKTDTILGLMAASTGRMASTNKKAFELNKKIRLAQAVMELPAAVMSSYTRAGGFPWGIIPAGLTLAAGLQNIQQIRASTFSSTSASASTGGGASTTSTPSPSPITPASDNVFQRTLNGDRNTVDSSESTGAQPINISFEISAVDARGIDQLLMDRKEGIINMVQSAYTERGVNGGPRR